jgi:hypothetical protein
MVLLISFSASLLLRQRRTLQPINWTSCTPEFQPALQRARGVAKHRFQRHNPEHPRTSDALKPQRLMLDTLARMGELTPPLPVAFPGAHRKAAVATAGARASEGATGKLRLSVTARAAHQKA